MEVRRLMARIWTVLIITWVYENVQNRQIIREKKENASWYEEELQQLKSTFRYCEALYVSFWASHCLKTQTPRKKGGSLLGVTLDRVREHSDIKVSVSLFGFFILAFSNIFCASPLLFPNTLFIFKWVFKLFLYIFLWF